MQSMMRFLDPLLNIFGWDQKKGEVRQYLAQSLFVVKFFWEGAQIWEPFFVGRF